MTIYISILRGINVSGQKKILMADLKSLYEGLGLKNITTYIQSGNVIFQADKKTSPSILIEKISAAILKRYGFHVPIIIRSKEEMQHILIANPFLTNKKINIEKLHITFLSDIPEEELVEKIKSTDYTPDQFYILEKEVYIHCPESYGETKLSNTFFEKKLNVTATTRNWNTFNKLTELALND
jgi:uncharacterized protein (DUF1697 family)